MSVATIVQPTKVVVTGKNQAIVVQPVGQVSPVVVESPTSVMPVVVEFGGPQGAPGSGGEGGDLHFVFTQGAPASTWTVTHNLNKFPSVLVQDSANSEIEGDIEYVSLNQLIVKFSAAFSGKAYLN